MLEFDKRFLVHALPAQGEARVHVRLPRDESHPTLRQVVAVVRRCFGDRETVQFQGSVIFPHVLRLQTLLVEFAGLASAGLGGLGKNQGESRD